MKKWLFLSLLLLIAPQIAVSQIATQTRLLEPPGEIAAGESVSLMAAVTADYGTPTGDVEFFRRGRSLGAAPLIPLRAGQGSIAAGTNTSCAIESDGNVWCWGTQPLGTQVPWIWRPTPVQVEGLPGPAYQVALNWDHACALTDSGAVWCWGDNGFGQLGTTVLAPGFGGSNTAVPVEGMQDGVIMIDVGSFHSCAVMQDGAL